MSETRFFIHVFVGSLLLPTIGYLSVDRARRATRPLAARIGAWLAMYVGQLAIPCGLIAIACVMLGGDWWRSGETAAAVVYGAGVAMVAAVITLSAARMFLLGPLVLSAGTHAIVTARATSLVWRGGVTFGLVALALASVLHWIPIPGRMWEPLIYIALVIIPLALTSTLLLLVGVVLRSPPWLPR